MPTVCYDERTRKREGEKCRKENLPAKILIKVSFQGVVALVGHFTTLCQERDFYEAFFFSLLIFKKKRQIL